MESNLIKSDQSIEQTPIPFQFDDIQAFAKQIIKKATAQAQNLLSTAREQAVELEKTAFSDGFSKGEKEGYEKGYAEGNEKGYSEINEMVSTKTDNLASALSEILKVLSAERVTLKQDSEVELINLSIAIAKKIIKRELSVSKDVVRDTAKEAIALTVERKDIVFFVNSADVKSLEEYLPELKAEFSNLGRVSIEEDDTVSVGGVVVRNIDGEVNLKIEEQIKIIENSLVGGISVTEE